MKEGFPSLRSTLHSRLHYLRSPVSKQGLNVLLLQVDPSGGHPIAQTPKLANIDPESSLDSDGESDQAEDELECYPRGAPSILANKYLAAQGSRIVLGATRRTGLSPVEAFQVEV